MIIKTFKSIGSVEEKPFSLDMLWNAVVEVIQVWAFMRTHWAPDPQLIPISTSPTAWAACCLDSSTSVPWYAQCPGLQLQLLCQLLDFPWSPAKNFGDGEKERSSVLEPPNLRYFSAPCSKTPISWQPPALQKWQPNRRPKGGPQMQCGADWKSLNEWAVPHSGQTFFHVTSKS